MATITGNQIPVFRAITLLKGLKLETMGMKMSRGQSCYAIIKAEYGLKGNKQKVYQQFQKIVEEMKELREESINDGAENML